MRPKIEDEIECLIKENDLKSINKYSTSVVPIVKHSGDIRLCGDYRVTLNIVLPEYPYPIPSVQHLLSPLVDGEYFAKLDMAQPYLQLCRRSLDDHRTSWRQSQTTTVWN